MSDAIPRILISEITDEIFEQLETAYEAQQLEFICGDTPGHFISSSDDLHHVEPEPVPDLNGYDFTELDLSFLEKKL